MQELNLEQITAAKLKVLLECSCLGASNVALSFLMSRSRTVAIIRAVEREAPIFEFVHLYNRSARGNLLFIAWQNVTTEFSRLLFYETTQSI